MATDPLKIGNVLWPNQYQMPTGIVAGAASDRLSPQAIAQRTMPAETARPPAPPSKPDTTVSTDSTKGRAIDTYA